MREARRRSPKTPTPTPLRSRQNIKTIKERYDEAAACRASTKDAFGAGKTEKLFNAPEWKELYRGLPRLRNLHLRLPDLPVLRHQGFRHRTRRHPLPMLGLAACTRTSPRCPPVSRDSRRWSDSASASCTSSSTIPRNNNGLFGCVGCGRCVAEVPDLT